MNKVLMIAFHYPPFQGSSSVHRIVNFVRHLPEYGWEPVILTVDPVAYPPAQIGPCRESASPIVVERAPSFDTARHLSVRGRYPNWMALPDRWWSWALGALPAGLRLVREHRPDAIWSTFPIATAHLLALGLQRLTGIRWIADFRDSMTEDEYPHDPTTRRVHRWIERQVVDHSDAAVFTTPGAKRMYAERYPERPESSWSVIPNGFDETSFEEAERLRSRQSRPRERIVLVHSGLLYRSERDPRPFFDAVVALREAGLVSSDNLRIVLRASGDQDYHRSNLEQRKIDDIVRLEQPLSYARSLGEMLEADGLLVFQASNCNQQIPAKIYEYIRARRPILALTDPEGDTADALRQAGVGRVARLDCSAEIAGQLTEFLDDIRAGRAPIASDAEIRRHSRATRVRELSELLSPNGFGRDAVTVAGSSR